MHRHVLAGLLAALCLSVVGCSEKYYPVSGTLTLDGKPVDGATVTFISSDGRQGSGFTDEGGNFTISGPNPKAVGLPAGTYKVTVTKVPAINAEAPTEGGKMGGDYMKYINDSKKATAGKQGMPPGVGPPGGKGPPMGMMPMGGGGGSSDVKTLLPKKYADADSSGFSFTIPTDNNAPIKIEMKSK